MVIVTVTVTVGGIAMVKGTAMDTGKSITKATGMNTAIVSEMDMDITRRLDPGPGRRRWLLHDPSLNNQEESPNTLDSQYLAREGLIRINFNNNNKESRIMIISSSSTSTASIYTSSFIGAIPGLTTPLNAGDL